MKNAMLVFILSAVLVVGAASVYAAAPINGVYKSTDGDFVEGNESTRWSGGDFLAPGNYFEAFSVSGFCCNGDQWYWKCPQVVSVNLEADLVFNGYGSKIYTVEYTGGTFFLGGGALPWANGQSYTGSFTTFTEIRTLIFAANVMVGSDSDYSFTGTFDGFPQSCLSGIANGTWLGSEVPGGDFDPFEFGLWGCTPDFVIWDVGNVRDLTMTIGGCTVATEESTWGHVKSLYRD